MSTATGEGCATVFRQSTETNFQARSTALPASPTKQKRVAAASCLPSELGARMEVASAIARRSPDGNLTPRDIEELITVTSEVQAKVAYLTLLLRLEENALQKKVEEIPQIEQKKNQH